MKLNDFLREAVFEGRFQVFHIEDGYLIIPLDSAVNNLIRLKAAIASVEWKINSKSGSLSKLLKFFNKGESVKIDFTGLEQQLDEIFKAVAIIKEPMSYEEAHEMLKEVHEMTDMETWKTIKREKKQK